MSTHTHPERSNMLTPRTKDGLNITPGMPVHCAEYPGHWEVIEVVESDTYGIRIEDRFWTPNNRRYTPEGRPEPRMRKWVHHRSLTYRSDA